MADMTLTQRPKATEPSRHRLLPGIALAVPMLAAPIAAQAQSASDPASAGSSAGAGPSVGGVLSGTPSPGGFANPSGSRVGLSADSGTRPGTVGFPYTAFDRPLEDPGAAGEPTRTVTIVPSLGLELSYNDNIDSRANNKRSDVIVRVLPGVLVNLDSARLQGTFNYVPYLDFYTSHSDENRISHNFNGQGLATVVPGLFFVDARGSAAVQSLSGDGSSDGMSSGGRGDQVQTYSFSISPFVTYRFGGLASVRAGYVMQYVNQDRVDRGDPMPWANLPPGQQPFSFTPSDYMSHQFYAAVRTGEDFGRLAMQGSVSGTTFDGDGLYDGAYRNIALVETRYAITPTIAGLVEFGYETQRFNTVPRTDIDEPVWAVGVRLTPTPESVIIAKYGHRDGFNSFYLNGTVEAGVRTRLFANYSERLTTSALSAGDLLSSITLDPLGNPVDAMTGAPVLPSFANSTLGIQSGLVRETSASLSASQTWLRDRFTLSLSHTKRQPVADAPGTNSPGFEQKSYSISLSWSHDLGERTALTTFAQYSRTDSEGSGKGNTYSGGTSLSYLFSPTLTGSLSYRLRVNDDGDNFGSNTQDSGSVVQNVITAGVRQTF